MQGGTVSTGLDTQSAAAYVGCSPSLLALLRRTGGGPAFYRVGRRLIRYRLTDLDAWISATRENRLGLR